MITKKCRGYNGHHACAEDYPDHILPIENFTKYHHRSVDIAGRCKVCVHYQNQIVGLNKQFNPRTNAISAIAYGYVGSSSKFYDLSKQERSHYRNMATMEYSKLVTGTPSFPAVPSAVAPFRTHRALPKVDRPKGRRVTIFKPNDPRGFVYIFKDHMKSVNGRLYYYKVGASHDRQERLNQANTWGDFESVWESDMVDNCASLEREIHEILSRYKVKGEWFQVDKTFIINKIEELIDAREEQAMYVVS